jgi:hypothetical protein
MQSPDKLSPEYLFQKKTGLRLGKLLRNGNGKIYSLKDYPKRVVKIDESLDADNRRYLMRIISYLKKNKVPVVVKLYETGILRGGFHYYVMDRLKPLKNKWNTEDKLSTYIYQGHVPPTETKQVKAFVKGTIKLNDRYNYGDLHGGNIMRDKDEALKLVDLESFTY